MSEFTDLLLTFMPPAEALLFIGLGGIDLAQVRWMDGRVSRAESRIGRVEEQAMTDGGEPDE